MVPKMQMAIFLFSIAISTVLFEKQLFPFLMISLAVLTTVSADIIFLRLCKVRLFLPSAAIVSGLIIGLLVSPTLPWYNTVVTAVIAMAAKNFLRYENKHLFNPAALGLFIAGLLFRHSISWWGVSFQILTLNPASILYFLILLLPGYVSMIRLRRYKILLGFLGLYILFIGSILDPTVIFFALVMLPEPRTTPNNPLQQLLFGAFVATIARLSGFLPFTSFSLDPLLAALLVGNLLFFKFR